MVDKKDKKEPKAKKPRAPKDPNRPKGFGFTLKGAAGDSIRGQAKYRGGKLQTSVTYSWKEGDEKKRKVGARAEHETKELAQTWLDNVKSKLTEKGWREKGGKGSKQDAFSIDDLPAPIAAAE